MKKARTFLHARVIGTGDKALTNLTVSVLWIEILKEISARPKPAPLFLRRLFGEKDA
jgi:hypothetical protein